MSKARKDIAPIHGFGCGLARAETPVVALVLATGMVMAMMTTVTVAVDMSIPVIATQ